VPTRKRILHLKDNLVKARRDALQRPSTIPSHVCGIAALMMDILQRELMRARRWRKGGVTIILGDTDHFKNVNDSYGHGAGDEALREVACRLGDSVRSYDAVRRYGGEEFLIVLNGCRTRTGANRAETIPGPMHEHPFETATGPLAISMSLGESLPCFRRFRYPAWQRIRCPR
jgi:diguanylate cyclase (GGDEF)-like protein